MNELNKYEKILEVLSCIQLTKYNSPSLLLANNVVQATTVSQAVDEANTEPI